MGRKKTLAATLKVYAFPGAGQAAAQQSQDENECYVWAVGRPGCGRPPPTPGKDARPSV
jgi:hypothetical protein